MGSQRRGWVVLLAAVLVSACARTAVPAAESGPITFVTGPDASQDQVLHRLIGQWNQTHPATPVRVVELSSSSDLASSQMLAAEQSSDTSYDVLNTDMIRIPQFAAAGAIQPLDPSMLGADGPPDFLQASQQSATYQGRLWAVPFTANAGLLYYRKDLLGSVGMPFQDWQQVYDMADRLRQSRPDPQPMADYVTQLRQYEGLTVNAMEVAWSSDEEDLTSLKTASKGLENLAGDVQNAKILPDSLNADETASLQDFRDGKAFFLRNWPYAYDVLASSMPQSSIGVTLLPGPGNPSALGGEDLAVAAHTTKPQLARALINFLTSPPSQRCLLEGGFSPAREGIYRAYLQNANNVDYPNCTLAPLPPSASTESGGHRLYQDGDALKVLYQALLDVKLRAPTPYYPEATSVIQQTVAAMLKTRDVASANQYAEELPTEIRKAMSGQ